MNACIAESPISSIKDETSPRILSTFPSTNYAVNQSPDLNITITFDDQMDLESFNTNTFYVISKSDSTRIPIEEYAAVNKYNTIRLRLSQPLEDNHEYDIILAGNIRNKHGLLLRSNFKWTFATGTTNTAQTISTNTNIFSLTNAKFTLKAWYGRYVAAEDSNYGSNAINADRTSIGPYEIWSLHDAGNDKFALKAWHKKYLSALDDGTLGTVLVDGLTIGQKESWTLIKQDGKYALQSWAGKYLAAEDGDHGYPAIHANRNAIGPYERWEIIIHRKVSVRAWHGKYLTCNPSGSDVNAGALTIGSNEIWYLIDLDNGKYTLQAANVKYFTRNTDASITADQSVPWPGSSSEWVVTKLADGTNYSFLASNGDYLAAEDVGNGYPAINANRASVGAQEKWTFIFH